MARFQWWAHGAVSVGKRGMGWVGPAVAVGLLTPAEGSVHPHSGGAIVAGAVGSAAPCFPMGWAEGVEVDFMIDTGSQVTILATSVFEKMCVSDPRVRSRLRPCGRRFISADSPPLTVSWLEL